MNKDPVNKLRRNFFRSFLSRAVDDVQTVHEEFRERPRMRLPDLGHFPDHVLRGVTPVFSARIKHELRGTVLCIRDTACNAMQESLQLSATDAAILELFGRGLTLQQVADSLDCSASKEVAGTYYAHVRALFVSLARCGVCHPAESLADLDLGGH